MTTSAGAPLSVTTERIALRRVSQGRVSVVPGWYLDRGRPVPSYLTGPLTELRRRGLIERAATTGQEGQLRRVELTDAGRYRFAELTSLQQHPEEATR